MSVIVTRGTNKKPVSSAALAGFFEDRAELEGYLFLGYPIIGTAEGKYTIDAIWLTPQKGIVIFDNVEDLDEEMVEKFKKILEKS